MTESPTGKSDDEENYILGGFISEPITPVRPTGARDPALNRYPETELEIMGEYLQETVTKVIWYDPEDALDAWISAAPEDTVPLDEIEDRYR